MTSEAAHADAPAAPGPLDRYGGGLEHAPPTLTPAAPEPRAFLTWTAKTPGAAPATRPPVASTPSAAAASAAAAPVGRKPWVEGAPRFYSVHRQYGLEPDAIPLPPAFFGATADLSKPAADPVYRKVTTPTGQTRYVQAGADVPDAP